MIASQQNRRKETIGRWYWRYFGIGGSRGAEQGSGRVGANSSSFDDKHCFVVDQRFVAGLSKMFILLHREIQLISVISATSEQLQSLWREFIE
jgi:hypothetical protein